MRGVVEGEKVVSEMDHDVEYRTVAPEIENALMIREHSALQEVFDEKFDFAHDGIVVLSAEAATPSIIAMVVDDPIFGAILFQDAELVEYDVSEILFQREQEGFRAFRQVSGLEERVRFQKTVGHVRED
jgi:hypothetical protein